MSISAAISRETGFMVRDKSIIAWVVVAFLLSVFAIGSGLVQVAEQRASIERLITADEADRESAIAGQDTWGGAAYYSFHFTYNPPSDFAFAALGQRDTLPWKHRVRMLALEGQIYERDATNPELALIGRFDFAFLVAFVLPLILIVMLHDIRSSERAAGRYELLSATAQRASTLWALRALLRAALLAIAVLVPLLIGGWISGATTTTLLLACALVLGHVAFWTLVCCALAAWRQPSPVILAGLTGIWVLVALILPAAGSAVTDRWQPLPSGAELIMTQREAVNDAWDLPKEATMLPFLARHPEWSDHAEISSLFEWKWYYAFQQVGDQKTETLTAAYREGRLKRDQLAARLSILSPPAYTERALQNLAQTDVRSMMDYEQQVRDFHARLRAFFYPKLFRDEPFDPAALAELPVYGAGG